MIRIWYKDSRRCEYGRAKIELQQLGVWIWLGASWEAWRVRYGAQSAST